MQDASYKTFIELAEYTKSRAKRSAARNDPNAWSYWMDIYQWAELEAFELGHLKDQVKIFKSLAMQMRRQIKRAIEYDQYTEAARAHGKLSHLVRMLRQSGEKIKQPSQRWLQDCQEWCYNANGK